MNADRMAMMLAALQVHALRGCLQDAYFYHDDDCPCLRSNMPLAACTCEPWVEIHGTTFLLDVAGHLVPLTRS